MNPKINLKRAGYKASVFESRACGRVKKALLATTASLAILTMTGQQANAETENQYVAMSAQPLAEALQLFAKKRSLNIIFTSALLASEASNHIEGAYSTREALGRLLAGTGLGFDIDNDGNIYINDKKDSVEAVQFRKISLNTTDEYLANLGSFQDVDAANDPKEEQKQFQLDEITVTASRRVENLQNVAAGITSVDPDDYLMKGMISVASIIDYTPGVNFTTHGAPGLGAITIRGAGQEGSTPVVGSYVDDVPFSTNSPYSAGADIIFDGLLGDIERVEIIKGPQGTLYGAGAVGGVVKYITKDPALEEFRANALVDLSITKDGGISQLYKGTVSAPIVEDKVGFTISGFYNDLAGFIDRIDSPLTVAADNVNSAQTYGVSANALIRFSDAGELKLGSMYYKTKNSATSAVDFTYPGLQPAAGRYDSTAGAAPGDIRYKKLDATLAYDFEWAELTSVTAYMSYESAAGGDETPTFGAVADQITGTAPGTNTVPFDTSVASKKFVQEVRLASPDSEEFEWLVGLFYSNEDTDNTQTAIAEPTGFNFLDVAFPSEYQEKAIFGNLTYYITPDFDVTVGVRHSDNELAVDAKFTGLFTDNSTFKGGVEDKVTTYSFNSRYRVNDDMSLYARVASGYRPAFVNLPIVDPATGLTLNEPIVDADMLWSYELGMKGTLPESRVRYDLALWKIDWNEFQSFLTFQNISTTTNAEKGISAYGFEGTIQYFPIDDLAIETTFSYSNSTLDDDSVNLGGLKGEPTRNLPKWTASVKADYSFEIGQWDGTIGAGLRYTGKHDSEYLGGVAANGDIVTPSAINFHVPSRMLVDMNVGFTMDEYTISFYATNLLDNYTIVGGGVGQGLNGLQANVGIARPRTVGVSLGMKF